MFYAGYFLAELALIGFGNLMADELHFRVRMLACGQTSKVLIANVAIQAPPASLPCHSLCCFEANSRTWYVRTCEADSGLEIVSIERF